VGVAVRVCGGVDVVSFFDQTHELFLKETLEHPDLEARAAVEVEQMRESVASLLEAVVAAVVDPSLLHRVGQLTMILRANLDPDALYAYAAVMMDLLATAYREERDGRAGAEVG
jgi:hypothetical protein